MKNIYNHFSRSEWAALRANTPLTLSEEDLKTLLSLNDKVSLKEVEEIYLPLSRLLNLYVASMRNLDNVADAFLGTPSSKTPFIIGVAGSVAVGKSTTARILQALLSRWPDHPNVALVTTDGFLYPNKVLTSKDLMTRKGFPESYDGKRLMQFVMDIKAGVPRVEAPVYSHTSYDIVPGEVQVVEHADILILEGLNVLQTGSKRKTSVFVSDFFDFSIYLHADKEQLERWYVNRFLTLRDTVFQNPDSYFQRFANLSDEEAIQTATNIWKDINLKNLKHNILPSRERAKLILKKGERHLVDKISLRKL